MPVSRMTLSLKVSAAGPSCIPALLTGHHPGVPTPLVLLPEPLTAADTSEPALRATGGGSTVPYSLLVFNRCPSVCWEPGLEGGMGQGGPGGAQEGGLRGGDSPRASGSRTVNADLQQPRFPQCVGSADALLPAFSCGGAGRASVGKPRSPRVCDCSFLTRPPSELSLCGQFVASSVLVLCCHGVCPRPRRHLPPWTSFHWPISLSQ